jgi:hypothetical protein
MLAITLLASTGCRDHVLPMAASAERPLSMHTTSNCIVTTTEDSGPGSLRAALANEICGGITFALSFPATIGLTTGELLIDRSVVVNGPGAGQLIIARDVPEGPSWFRVIHVADGATVMISGVTVTGGRSWGPGGGILNNGTMTLANSVVSGNDAQNVGGIFNRGVFELVNSTVSNNEGWRATGGFGNSGVARLIGSTISANGAYDDPGGGIFNEWSGVMTIVNSTVSGNEAPWDPGGGIFNQGTLVLQHSTVTGNRGRWGGGISSGPNLLIENSIVAGNTAERSAPDIGASQLTARYSLIGTVDDYTLADGSGNNVIAPQDLGLAALADNGGPTWTHALLPGGPALDVGSCTDPTGTTALTDQRGITRPQGRGCDIGAFELEQAPPTPSELLEALITASASTPGVSRGTNNKLLEARDHLGAGRILPACNKLREYIADVQSQSGKKISSADAARLIGMAQEVRASLLC